MCAGEDRGEREEERRREGVKGEGRGRREGVEGGEWGGRIVL